MKKLNAIFRFRRNKNKLIHGVVLSENYNYFRTEDFIHGIGFYRGEDANGDNLLYFDGDCGIYLNNWDDVPEEIKIKLLNIKI